MLCARTPARAEKAPELSRHLGYLSGADKPEPGTHQRNGTSGKTVLTEGGPLRIDVSRDRDGSSSRC